MPVAFFGSYSCQPRLYQGFYEVSLILNAVSQVVNTFFDCLCLIWERLCDMLRNMEYFFVFDHHLPQGVGIGWMGGVHIGWLLFAALAIFGLCRACRRADAPRFRFLQRAVCAGILVTEVVRELCLLSAGVWGVYTLPLHLCSLSVFVVLWHTLRGNALSGELLYCLGMPGAAMALLFPDWLYYPAANLMSINSFLGHILLTAYPAMLTARGAIVPDVKRLPKCFACLAATSAVIFVFDKLTNSNYFFLNSPSPGSPLVFFERWLGNPGFIVGYLPLIAALWLLLYLPWVLVRRLRRPAG